MIHVGLGQTEGIDTPSVTNRVINSCRQQMGHRSPTAGIVFAGSRFDHQVMLDLIHNAFDNIQLLGCTTAGDYSSAFGFSDDSITLMTLASDTIEIATGVGYHLSEDHETAVGTAVKSSQEELSQAPRICLTFPAGYDLNFEPILKTLAETLGKECPVFGGASGTQWSDDIYLFYGREILTDALPILLMAGPVEYAFTIANSWKPLGSKTMVTQSEGRTVSRLGHMDAVGFYRHYLGYHEEPAKEFILAVYETDSDDFYIRAPISYHDDGSVTFSGTIPEGAQVQLTEAARDDLIKDTIAHADQLKSEATDWDPAMVFAFSCAFRKEILGTQAQKELDILKQAFPKHLPIMGFYSFGEIAPLVQGGWSMTHGATLIGLSIGAKGSESQKGTPASSLQSTTEQPAGAAALDQETQNEFLRLKLQRSELYRQRLEAAKAFNSQMHLRIMTDMDEARQEIMKKEALLRKSEEKYRRIVQTTGEGFILMDENLILIDANDAYCRLLGYSRPEILGKSNVDLATPEFRRYLEANKEILLEKEYRKFEGELVRKKGSIVPVLIHGNTLRGDQGEIIGHMAFITDMTEHKKALALAGEVQKSLLPQEDPKLPGLDVAGRNVSCDEVGGDYFDFFWRREAVKTPFSVAVGDITGHGVDAALLMSSARAFLRLHSSQQESISSIVHAANTHLSEDVSETGRFMTLFYLTVDAELDSIEWIRAGHDPAILYDPHGDTFEELKGPGIALGIDEAFAYQASRKEGLKDGQVIAIGTDGIWESCNQNQEMFGRERFKDILRSNTTRSAAEILNAVFVSLDEFTHGRKPEDDVTLVIIKIQKKNPD